jgi:hypothetical protein
MKFIVKNGDFTSPPTMCLLLKYYNPNTDFSNSSLAVGGENATGSGVMGSGVAIVRSGTNPSNHIQGSLSTFNPVVELFKQLSMNYEMVQREKLKL